MKFTLASALAGGSLGPAYRRPATPVPSAWQTRIAATGPTGPSTRWWRTFGSPQLDRLLGGAEHSHNDRAAAMTRVREADAEVTIATAPVLPSITATLTGNRQTLYNLFSAKAGGVFNHSVSTPFAPSNQVDFWGENRAVRAAFFPSIDRTASAGLESTTLKTVLDPSSRIFDVAGALTQPIFHGRARLGPYRYRKARYAERLADYRKAVLSAFANVEAALTAVRGTTDPQRRENDTVRTSRQAYDLARTEFHAGPVDILTGLSTQSALFTAAGAFAQIKLAHLQALVGLFNALGGSWHR